MIQHSALSNEGTVCILLHNLPSKLSPKSGYINLCPFMKAAFRLFEYTSCINALCLLRCSMAFHVASYFSCGPLGCKSIAVTVRSFFAGGRVALAYKNKKLYKNKNLQCSHGVDFELKNCSPAAWRNLRRHAAELFSAGHVL